MLKKISDETQSFHVVPVPGCSLVFHSETSHDLQSAKRKVIKWHYNTSESSFISHQGVHDLQEVPASTMTSDLPPEAESSLSYPAWQLQAITGVIQYNLQGFRVADDCWMSLDKSHY